MAHAHRPFWILRHRVTGMIKRCQGLSGEDGLWEVVLSDGSDWENQPGISLPVEGKGREHQRNLKMPLNLQSNPNPLPVPPEGTDEQGRYVLGYVNVDGHMLLDEDGEWWPVKDLAQDLAFVAHFSDLAKAGDAALEHNATVFEIVGKSGKQSLEEVQ